MSYYTYDSKGRSDDFESSDSEDSCGVPGVSGGYCRLSTEVLQELVESYLTTEKIHLVEISGGHFGHSKKCVKCGEVPEVGQLGANINSRIESWRGRQTSAYDRLCQPCLEGWVLLKVGNDAKGCAKYDNLSKEARTELKELRVQEAKDRRQAASAEKKRLKAAAAAAKKQQAADAALQAQQAKKKSKKNAAKPLSVNKPIGKRCA